MQLAARRFDFLVSSAMNNRNEWQHFSLQPFALSPNGHLHKFARVK
jgi:hypothetical protein